MPRPLPAARRLGIALVILAAVATAVPAAAGSFTELAAAIDGPRLGERVAAEPIAVGRGVIDPGSGRTSRPGRGRELGQAGLAQLSGTIRDDPYGLQGSSSCAAE